MNKQESLVKIVRVDDTPFDAFMEGHAVARGISEHGGIPLGGGWTRMRDPEVGFKWRLNYDEVLYVHRGYIDVETESGERFIARENEALVLPKDVVVTYRGDGDAFFVIHPGNWSEKIPWEDGKVE